MASCRYALVDLIRGLSFGVLFVLIGRLLMEIFKDLCGRAPGGGFLEVLSDLAIHRLGQYGKYDRTSS